MLEVCPARPLRASFESSLCLNPGLVAGLLRLLALTEPLLSPTPEGGTWTGSLMTRPGRAWRRFVRSVTRSTPACAATAR